MNISHDIIALVVFAVFGFFLGYLLLRAAGFVFFGLFLYAALLLLHIVKFQVDWGLLNTIVGALGTVGKSSYQLAAGMLAAATALHLMFFITGGIFGLVTASGRR